MVIASKFRPSSFSPHFFFRGFFPNSPSSPWTFFFFFSGQRRRRRLFLDRRHGAVSSSRYNPFLRWDDQSLETSGQPRHYIAGAVRRKKFISIWLDEQVPGRAELDPLFLFTIFEKKKSMCFKQVRAICRLDSSSVSDGNDTLLVSLSIIVFFSY